MFNKDKGKKETLGRIGRVEKEKPLQQYHQIHDHCHCCRRCRYFALRQYLGVPDQTEPDHCHRQ